MKNLFLRCMRKLLATLTCFLLAICRVSAQSPNTDLQPVKNLQPVKSRTINLHIKINIITNPKSRSPSMQCFAGWEKQNDTTTIVFIDGIRLVDKIKVSHPPYWYQTKTFSTNTAYPRNLGQIVGTPAAYSYDNKYVYKPTQPF